MAKRPTMNTVRALFLSVLCGCSVIASSGEFEFDDRPIGCQSDDECEAAPQQSAECAGGVCVTTCLEGFADCDGLAGNGCEIDLQNDADSCGACENSCDLRDALARCSEGTCAVESCLGSSADCDGDSANGCEANLSSPAHCLACNMACPAARPFCQVEDGERSCASECSEGLELCGETCADTRSDIDHCGACGDACEGDNATWLCSAGLCEVEECLEGFFDCDGDASNGCEVDGRDDLMNCGACGEVCDFPGAEAACSASECVLVRCPRHLGRL